jgi:hypothetical protein
VTQAAMVTDVPDFRIRPSLWDEGKMKKPIGDFYFMQVTGGLYKHHEPGRVWFLEDI